MRSIENIHNLNDLIIEFESKLTKDIFSKELLINESFILWYILVEEIPCENFENEELEKLLKRNFKIFLAQYTQDVDFNFIMGWMINVAFWYFKSDISEDYGFELLNKAYESRRYNSLFKWAVRDKLNLSSSELDKLKTDMQLKFEEFYNYGAFIKSYFLSVSS